MQLLAELLHLLLHGLLHEQLLVIEVWSQRAKLPILLADVLLSVLLHGCRRVVNLPRLLAVEQLLNRLLTISLLAGSITTYCRRIQLPPLQAWGWRGLWQPRRGLRRRRRTAGWSAGVRPNCLPGKVCLPGNATLSKSRHLIVRVIGLISRGATKRRSASSIRAQSPREGGWALGARAPRATSPRIAASGPRTAGWTLHIRHWCQHLGWRGALL
mmetsp:Transcript_22840/g.53403  ORF Transcript_22840/g.53403 Transcript_22840/m.53403 type:complete len:214 (+) Transcript_22840:456-1097(+)